MKKVIKRIFLIILLIAVIYLGWRISLFVRAKIIENKMKEALSRDFYVKFNSLNETISMEEWHLAKYAKITRQSENYKYNIIYDGDYNTIITYNSGDSSEIKPIMNVHYQRANDMDFSLFSRFNDKALSVYITDWSFENIKNLNTSESFFDNLIIKPFTSIQSIKTESVAGKECYVINNKNKAVFYIDKETNLPVKEIATYNNNIEEIYYEFSFEPITKGSLDIPNLEEYYVIVN